MFLSVRVEMRLLLSILLFNVFVDALHFSNQHLNTSNKNLLHTTAASESRNDTKDTDAYQPMYLLVAFGVIISLLLLAIVMLLFKKSYLSRKRSIIRQNCDKNIMHNESFNHTAQGVHRVCNAVNESFMTDNPIQPVGVSYLEILENTSDNAEALTEYERPVNSQRNLPLPCKSTMPISLSVPFTPNIDQSSSSANETFCKYTAEDSNLLVDKVNLYLNPMSVSDID